MASQFVTHSNARHLEGSWMVAIRFIRNVETYGIRDLAVLVLQIRSRKIKNNINQIKMAHIFHVFFSLKPHTQIRAKNRMYALNAILNDSHCNEFMKYWIL